MLEETLAQLGLTTNEVTIYLAVMRHGTIVPASLAKVTGLNRTTVYSVAKTLLQKGLIHEDLGTPTRALVAVPAAELTQLIDKEKQALDEKEQLITQAVANLEFVERQSKYLVPKITFIEEEGIESYLYKQTPKWNKSLLEVDPTWWGFQDDTFVANYGEWIRWYWEKGTEAGINLKLLSIETDIEKEMQAKGYKNRIIKYWRGLKVDATTWINGDYVVMIVTNQRPHYLVEIHDAVLARNQREIYKQIWRTLEKDKLAK